MDTTTGTDWRDTLRDAADLALAGIAVTVAALPLLTAGAALAVGAEAVHLRFAEGRWPALGDLVRTFGRRLLPGAAAVLTVLAAALLLALNAWWLRSGAVPGGGPLLLATGAVGVALTGAVALSIPLLGRGYGYRQALRTALTRPAALAAAAGITLLAALLATLLPVTAPLLLGYVLLALHAVAARTR
ncbi:hypothetical protein Cs7R123_16670 [Catellatospora sp. TT07R-123]|uniref:hypothetical protein n=1 Tax=Catellatospora sp. TT07R-123 TaxID=2733863 RepID=UPI001B295E7F|nr:hypothetical protein [Catellatospora sp. TT07R-123]GHJ44325.1 hypothetical protein Cs7R123_16670 [Catellatospora sp. TT07R-123]